MPSAITLRELRPIPADFALLRSFYDGLYTQEFPDPNERELHENMLAYLRGAAASANAYHIVIALADDVVVGASISDYFARSNAGVIEFIVIARGERGAGTGTALLRDTEEKLADDARRSGRQLGFVAAEINDPYLRSATPDNVDPFERARWWDRRGFGRFDFPYVQPALSSEQKPVSNLMLGAKTFASKGPGTVAAASVTAFLRDYLAYAMRIAVPETSGQYRAMAHWLDSRTQIGIGSLAAYVGEDPAHALDVRRIQGPHDPRLAETLAAYAASFADAATAIPANDFRALLIRREHELPFAYHLWGFADRPASSVAGMASFFTLPNAGFGGYISLLSPLRGTGALATILARIERRMVTDPGQATGWYVECAERGLASLFARYGFHEVALEYRQPSIGMPQPGESAAPAVLVLLYKEFGRRYEAPQLGSADFLGHMREIFRFVYDIAEPDEHESYRSLAAQLTGFPSGVPFA